MPDVRICGLCCGAGRIPFDYVFTAGAPLGYYVGPKSIDQDGTVVCFACDGKGAVEEEFVREEPAHAQR